MIILHVVTNLASSLLWNVILYIYLHVAFARIPSPPFVIDLSCCLENCLVMYLWRNQSQCGDSLFLGLSYWSAIFQDGPQLSYGFINSEFVFTPRPVRPVGERGFSSRHDSFQHQASRFLVGAKTTVQFF